MVQQAIKAMKRVLERCPGRAGGPVDRVYLVGGLGSSPYFRRRVQDELDGRVMEVVAPDCGHAAVLHGKQVHTHRVTHRVGHTS